MNVVPSPEATGIANGRLTEQAPSSWFCWSLFFLVLLGTGLRIAYIDRDYVNLDEQIGQSVVRSLHFPDQWDTNWAKTDVTKAFRYDQYNFSSYHYLLYFWKALASSAGIDWTQHPGVLRSLNGLFGVIFIGVTAFALRRSVGEIAGIAAAASGAVLPLLVQDAHYVRCESMMTAGVATLLWLSTLSPPRPRWVQFSAGLIAGLMVAGKVTMGLALPLLLPLLITAPSSLPSRWKATLSSGSLVGSGVILGVLVGVPWGVIQPQVFLSGVQTLASCYNAPMPPNTSPDMAPSFLVTLAYMKGTLGWSFWAVTILGAVHLGLIRLPGWWRSALMLLPLLGAYVVFGGHAVFAERNFSPFLPIAVGFFGAGVQRLVDLLSKYFKNPAGRRASVLILVLTATLALPAIHTWQIVFQGFSGHEQSEKDAALSRMRGTTQGKKLIMFSPFFYSENYREIAAATGNHEPVLVVLVDYYDPYASSCLTTLQGSFKGRVLGVRESIFPDLPTCSLHTLISPRLWLVYIPAK